MRMKVGNDLSIHWMFEGFRQDNPRWIIQIYQKDHLVKHSSALHSQPLHNLSPSHNPLILRRRSLKRKDNPPTRGCGGRKCLSGFLLFHPMEKKDKVSKKKIFFPIKRNQNGRKIRRSSSDFVHSTLTSRYTSSTVSFQIVSS